MLASFIVHLGIFAFVGTAAAQRPRAAQRPVVREVDSSAAVRRARNAQAAFEIFRRGRLPRSGRVSGPCDVIVGRYCYWRGGDDDSDDDKRPDEPAAIRERREQLLALLDSLAADAPADGWIAGQRVRYLADAGRPADAARVASTGCHAVQSWCAALEGYAWHRAGAYARADSSFGRALAAMSPRERCDWLDIGPLLAGAVASRFRHLDCAHRDSLARRVLRLGAPLYSVASSDLLTEHLSRVTRSRISDHSYMVEGPSWGDDSRDLVLRYGWPEWYTRAEAPFGSTLEASIIGHDAGRPFYFIPDARVLDHPAESTDDDWRLDDRLAPSGYAPAYARSIHAIPSQIARFRHGDTTIVVATWDVSADTTLAGRPLDAALVLTTDGADGRRSTRASARDRGSLITRALLDSGIVSLELLARDRRRAARERLGMPPRVTATVAMSDVLLYRPYPAADDSIPASTRNESLAQLAGAAMPTARVDAERRVGVYWETYGARAGASVEYSISVQPADVPWYRRAAVRLGLGKRESTLFVRWSDVARGGGFSRRAMELDLSRLRAGRYHLNVSAATGGATTTSRRALELP